MIAADSSIVDPPVITSVDIITDNENGVLKLLPLAESGSSTITVTVTDLDGNTAMETFEVTVVADQFNAQPFLVDEPLLDKADGTPQLSTVQNVPLTITLDSVDVEGDAVTYSAIAETGVNTSVSGDQLTITPPTDFIGIVRVQATVQQTDGNTPGGSGDSDSQIFNVAVLPPSPGALSLVASSGLGLLVRRRHHQRYDADRSRFGCRVGGQRWIVDHGGRFPRTGDGEWVKRGDRRGRSVLWRR